jgi:hypothetical protein
MAYYKTSYYIIEGFVNNFRRYSLDFFSFFADILRVNGLTAREIASILGITPHAALERLYAAGIQPKTHAGKTNIYDESVVDLIREVSKGGRPRKDDAKKGE